MKFILMSVLSLVMFSAFAQKKTVKEQRQPAECKLCEDLKPAIEKADIVEGINAAEPVLELANLSKDKKIRAQELDVLVPLAVKWTSEDLHGERTPGEVSMYIAGLYEEAPAEFEQRLRKYSVEEQAPVWEAIKMRKQMMKPGKDGLPVGESALDKPKKTGTK